MFRDVAQIKRLTDILSFQKATGNADVRGSSVSSSQLALCDFQDFAGSSVVICRVPIS